MSENNHRFNITFKDKKDKIKWLSLIRKFKFTATRVFKLGLEELIKKNSDYIAMNNIPSSTLNCVMQYKMLKRKDGMQKQSHIIDMEVGRKRLYNKIKVFEFIYNAVDDNYTIVYKDEETGRGQYKTMKKLKKFIKPCVLDAWFGKGNY